MSGVQVQRRIPECFESSLRQTGQFELDLPWALSVSHLLRANGCRRCRGAASLGGEPAIRPACPSAEPSPAKYRTYSWRQPSNTQQISQPRTSLILIHLHQNRKLPYNSKTAVHNNPKNIFATKTPIL